MSFLHPADTADKAVALHNLPDEEVRSPG